MNGSRIPFTNLSRQYDELRDEILEAQDAVYSSGKVLDGEQVQKFEELIAARCDRRWAVCVGSGTQALIFSLMCAKLNRSQDPGVLIPAVSFVATSNSVLMTGGRPLFVDVDQQGLFDFNRVDYHPTKDKISVLMYVNLYGNMVDQDRLKMYTEFFNNNQLVVIEDAAQSFGSNWEGQPSGSFGDLSVLSFDPMKNLPNYGSGGMVLTDDLGYYEYLIDLRDHGKAGQFFNAGTNSKMSEADCAAMLVKLKYFEPWQARRAEIAKYYDERLCDYVSLPQVSPKVDHSWHKYVIQTNDRNNLKSYLKSHGIETKVNYESPLPMHSSCFDPRRYPSAEALCNQVLSLPIYPELTDSEVEYIADTVIQFWER